MTRSLGTLLGGVLCLSGVVHAQALAEKTIPLPGGERLELVLIPPGSFERGSPPGEIGRQADEGPAHRVTMTSAFYLGRHEVTQAQWQAVMGTRPSVFRSVENPDRHPVESVSWEDVQRFLVRLNAQAEGHFRLPTEAEWEYACRAGTRARFPWGEDRDYRELRAHAWFYSGAEGRSHPVGTKQPNPWGLHDMTGNVWEWCQDWYGPYDDRPQIDPKGPTEGTARVIRGGSWFNEPEALRSANRHRHLPNSRLTNLGFRLVWIDGSTPSR
jgi:formylglycine-generating enzyme required for sulfatase activity